MKRTNIAVLGFGTVGGGVVELIEKNQEEVSRAAGGEVYVKYILDIRDFPGSPYADRVVRDVNTILEDPEIKVICETMGGTEPAFSYTRRALKRGISVCTSNKELVDAFGGELTNVAREYYCSYLFEASVGGGIPLLRPLREALKQEKLGSVMGILNGTCNYILTKMGTEDMEFADALKQAQENGFAERNPDADILGHDTARKLAILASLLSGNRVSHEQIPCEGITKITKADIQRARDQGKAIKLLGVCQRDPDTGSLSAMTAPCLVPMDNPLYGVSDVFNGVLVHGNMVGDVMFYGRGAGKLPTASAVVSDVIECVRNEGRFVDNGLPSPENKAVLTDFPGPLPGGVERLS
ncbi:MAG: homoserine dehydrogenase [Synergistaceae bacterium]|nr:homoserine dehydrogenase [Synergistaceae bacterium]